MKHFPVDLKQHCCGTYSNLFWLGQPWFAGRVFFQCLVKSVYMCYCYVNARRSIKVEFTWAVFRRWDHQFSECIVCNILFTCETILLPWGHVCPYGKKVCTETQLFIKLFLSTVFGPFHWTKHDWKTTSLYYLSVGEYSFL